MLDEPDSGIDLESLALVGGMVNTLLTAESSQQEKKAALIITHTGHILDAVAVDQAHIMLQGRIA
jgi:Fe-S cluster assembly ATP-binding protein